jgi:hypothetical protein
MVYIINEQYTEIAKSYLVEGYPAVGQKSADMFPCRLVVRVQ